MSHSCSLTDGAVVFKAGSDVLVHDGAELGRRPLRQLRRGPPALVCPTGPHWPLRQAGVHDGRGGPAVKVDLHNGIYLSF
jgi:hypothetical protein